jgi:hypothetical protein
MIVCCPACRTRYRYHEPVPDTGGQAVCANCEGLVPLVGVSRAYVLRAQVAAVPAGVAVGVAAGIGMDDPGSASSLQNTTFDHDTAADAPAMAYRVMAPEPALAPSGAPFDHPVEVPGEPTPLQEEPVPSLESIDGLALGGGPSVQTQSSGDAGTVALADEMTVPSKGRGAGRRVLELLAIVVLAAAGVAVGEYATMEGWLGPVEVHSTVEPVRLGIIGGLLGVLIAWAAIRWTTRKP